MVQYWTQSQSSDLISLGSGRAL